MFSHTLPGTHCLGHGVWDFLDVAEDPKADIFLYKRTINITEGVQYSSDILADHISRGWVHFKREAPSTSNITRSERFYSLIKAAATRHLNIFAADVHLTTIFVALISLSFQNMHSFSYIVAKYWNNAPNTIRTSDLLLTLKNLTRIPTVSSLGDCNCFLLSRIID